MLKFAPLSPGFGIEASGIDLSLPLSDSAFAELERAFYDHQVLALRAQEITAAQFVAFARRLGPPQPHVIDQFHHPEDPNILILSNVKKDGQPTGLQDAGSYFHTDYSYLQVPARATTLYSRVVPKSGGDTLFANQQAAYDDLSDAMKKRIEPLLRDPPLRQPQRPGREEPHRRLGADRGAKGEDAGDHAPRRAAASGHRPQIALRGVGQLVRHRRHAGGRGARTARRARRAFDAAEIPAALQVRRRRHRRVGQRVAAAFGDADRSERRAHAVADHGARAVGGGRGAGGAGADVRGAMACSAKRPSAVVF